MTCQYVRRHFADLFDAGNDPIADQELRRHLEACAECAGDFARLEHALAVPQPVQGMQASPDFKERVMQQLNSQLPTHAPSFWASLFPPRFGLKLAISAAAILAIAFALPYIGSFGGANSGAAALLAQSVQAMSHLDSVHISARMRTLPNDNFENIGMQYDFVPVEMWKQYGATPRWRIEKPGRVVVMDGAATTLLIHPNTAARGGTRTGFVEWLMPLLDADKVLQSELDLAKKKESQASLSQDVHNGALRTILTVTRKAQGDLTNDWLRNKVIFEADHTCVYAFDPATKRLTGLQVFVHDNAQDVLVFEITGVRYNESFDPKLFTIDLPANVVWMVSPEEMPKTSQPLPSTARDAAVAFFEGMAERNWDRVLLVYPVSAVDDRFKKAFGGIQVVSIGEPFQSGIYPGWFVPYEVRLTDGTVKKHNLALKQNRGRFYVDGGF